MAIVTSDRRPAAVRERWSEAARSLVEQVVAWAGGEPGWNAQRTAPKVLEEERHGPYELPGAEITVTAPDLPGGGRVLLERVGIDLRGSGVFELFAWPTLHRVPLLLDLAAPGASWTIMTDSGLPLRQPWTHETFRTLVRDLIDAGRE
jgi:hypothetical protein